MKSNLAPLKVCNQTVPIALVERTSNTSLSGSTNACLSIFPYNIFCECCRCAASCCKYRQNLYGWLTIILRHARARNQIVPTQMKNVIAAWWWPASPGFVSIKLLQDDDQRQPATFNLRLRIERDEESRIIKYYVELEREKVLPRLFHETAERMGAVKVANEMGKI